MKPNLWVYKCNRQPQSYSRAYGDWEEVFKKNRSTEWGRSWCTKNPVSMKIINDFLKPGDLVLAYQTNDRVLVGICKVTKIVGERNDKVFWLKPIHLFDKPIPVHDLKNDYPKLNEVSAFAPGFPQTIYAVSLREKRILEKILRVKLNVEHNEPVLRIEMSRSGAGFGDPINNRRVEKAAVAAVKRWYVRNKWKVVSHESRKRGYDLYCTRGTKVEHVEVKGVASSETIFNLTSNERRQAEDLPTFVICIVTNASQSPRITRLTGRKMCSEFEFHPLQFRAIPKRRN